MAIKIESERKYLLHSLPTIPFERSNHIIQGYLPDGSRIRKSTVLNHSLSSSVEYTHTIKTGSGQDRLEDEKYISEKQFNSFWPQTQGKRINKIRFLVKDYESIWEVDLFLDRQLVLAEIEGTPGFKPVIPAFVDSVLVMDVTESGEFTNSKLAS
jgi:CYTH domain-containing protein